MTPSRAASRWRVQFTPTTCATSSILGVYNVANWRYDAVPSGEFRQRTIVQSGRTFLATLGASF